jgi:Cation/multidrug efflux pump
MFALPLALIGAIIGLYVGGSQLSMMAAIGIVMLMGLVAKNGILLIDAAKERIKKGMPRNEALVEAGLVRLRPIIMTTLAMIFGMIPTALATGAGTEMRKPMAQAVIGGLITSTILTLFVVPIVYTILDGLKKRFAKKIHRKKSTPIDSESNVSI